MPDPLAYGTVRAPDFPAGLAWLNTPLPLRLADLRGRFVLLDFWTYCCINCLHVLPELQRLEAEFADVLAVVGVHSAKFDTEREDANVRQAVLRYGIEHPVVNDAGFALWGQYAVNAWPTLFLIDPRGYIVGKMTGEGPYEPFARLLRELVPRFESEGLLRRGALGTAPERDQEPERPLAFPGKVSADPVGRRLFLSDTNHHRVLVLDPDGVVLDLIGSGEAGFADGPLGEARFRNPQGTAYDPAHDVLYVADTENHALRRVDFATRTVTTLAGTGAQATWGVSEADGPRSALNSPWDVVLASGALYVAMAGAHQLWRFHPATGRGVPWAGQGREDLYDAPRADALFAQPSGLAVLPPSGGEAHGWLVVADSETSAVRRVPLAGVGPVETLVGEGLFDFGDADGARPAARLQHPLGVAVHDGVVYVADTYNHRIKRLTPPTAGRPARVATWLGTGRAGAADGPGAIAAFFEPGGLAVLGDTLYVADTNNHALRAAGLSSGTVRTVPITFPRAGARAEHAVTLAAQTLALGSDVLVVCVRYPVGYKPNPLDAGAVTVRSEAPAIARLDATTPYPLEADGTVRIPLALVPGETTLALDGVALFCAAEGGGNGACHVHPIALRLPVLVAPAGMVEAVVTVEVDAPD